jgi:uncharacterized membrane protein YedE/YeeE
MTIDWNHFTPWASLAGGVLIGLAAAAFVLLNGRVAGISGILGGLLFVPPQDRAWRIAFLAGLVVALPVWLAVAPMPEFRIDAGWGTLVVAGLLVGLGTRYAGGCTSGHGVCGLSRFSPRSLVATLSFMGAGFAAVFVLRHLVGG